MVGNILKDYIKVNNNKFYNKFKIMNININILFDMNNKKIKIKYII